MGNLVTDAVGGVWLYGLELARALRPLGIETVLAVTGPPPNTEQREEAADFRLIDTGLPLDWLGTSHSRYRLSVASSSPWSMKCVSAITVRISNGTIESSA